MEKLLYDVEKKGKYDSIQLNKKKSYLLAKEDPFLITDIPRFVFDETLISGNADNIDKVADSFTDDPDSSRKTNENESNKENKKTAGITIPDSHLMIGRASACDNLKASETKSAATKAARSSSVTASAKANNTPVQVISADTGATDHQNLWIAAAASCAGLMTVTILKKRRNS